MEFKELLNKDVSILHHYNEDRVTRSEISKVEADLNIQFPPILVSFWENIGGIGFDTLEDPATKVTYKIGDFVKHEVGLIEILKDLKDCLRDYATYSETMDSDVIDPDTEEVIDTVEARIPKTMFPIANNLGGDLFLMNINKENFGTIWYWKRRDITFGKEGNTLFGEVAPDFSSFLGSIKLQPVIEQEIENSN